MIRDALGNPTTYSLNGLLNAGTGYVNNRHEATRYAIYIADQMESDRWIFDIGARFEEMEGDIRRERSGHVHHRPEPGDCARAA